MKEIKSFLLTDRPQLVFDLSQVKQIDAAGVDMLLTCMSEAMKRDGDLKLAALSPQSALVLELTRTDRLFEIYETSTDAVRSYSGFLPNMLKHFYPPIRPAVHHVSSTPSDDSAPSSEDDGAEDIAA